MKRVIVISTSLRHGSNSDMLADQFVEGAKAAGNPESRLAGTVFCGGVNEPHAIEDNPKIQEAFDLGKSIG